MVSWGRVRCNTGVFAISSLMRFNEAFLAHPTKCEAADRYVLRRSQVSVLNIYACEHGRPSPCCDTPHKESQLMSLGLQSPLPPNSLQSPTRVHCFAVHRSATHTGAAAGSVWMRCGSMQCSSGSVRSQHVSTQTVIWHPSHQPTSSTAVISIVLAPESPSAA